MWWCVRLSVVLLAVPVMCQAWSRSQSWVSWSRSGTLDSWTPSTRTRTRTETLSTRSDGNWLKPSHHLAAQFCEEMMGRSGVLQDCGDYYYKNKRGRNGLLKWCIGLFMDHGMEAKCHIISEYVNKCQANGISVEDSIWREFHNCRKQTGVTNFLPHLIELPTKMINISRVWANITNICDINILITGLSLNPPAGKFKYMRCLIFQRLFVQ